MLFLELALIRWLGANIVHLAYFSNFVLLGSFLGIGLGFLRAAAPDHKARPQPYYSLVLLLGLVGFVSAYPVTVERAGSQLIFFTSLSTSGPPIWLTLPLVFSCVAAVLAGPAEIVGACFRDLPRLTAYRLDLIGSLTGIVTFTALAFLGSPPLVWFMIITVLFAVLLGRPSAGTSLALVLAFFAMFAYPLVHEKTTFWSPYYKVSTQAYADGDGGTAWTLSVNGVPHQALTSVAHREKSEPYYLEPYHDLAKQPKDVLIIGAGSGTDVAIALSMGVSHVDAVEIDPTLQRFGSQHNPNRAYQDPRVSVHINDGRAFLEGTDHKYDLIMLALPDSLTLVSGASSLRLESYLFTLQAMKTVRSHLADGGAFAMYNFYRENWLIDRYAGTVDEAFGHSPCVYKNNANFAVITVGLTAADQTCQDTWARPADAPAAVTDDRPFPYLENAGIPSLYRNAIALIVLASILGIAFVLALNSRAGGPGALRRWTGSVREMATYRDLLLLGAAFLLIETKSVTGFALLFGTTWLVNSLVFAGVLVVVLIAVEVTARWRTPPLPIMYGLLVLGLVLNWLVPVSWLLSLPLIPRGIVAIGIAFLPILAANVIFAKRFSDTANAPLAFATNLLGAIVGGCLEYLSLAFGYHALLIVAGLLYLLALLLTPRRRESVRDGSVTRRGRPVSECV
jgi:spermidine synthase